ncbi:LppM family (lipo)protein [Actinomyces glycerinitolerans]|uniref:LppM domain-containing protein n=1 Tax=Actinomyces glycerinitolerans TaxID=1892869 RepID=A0A1M4S0Q6_9ACTO|nr:hypothetical protein [Actinomyces glycerinitolerans]SHE25792.1 Hypothetical protein ACGLYG10_2028 [Actinomyces glycerinitolerans]
MSPKPLADRRKRALAHRLAITVGAAALVLSGCTAHMDMHLDAAGTYAVDLVMRDTTGAVFTDGADCESLTADSLIGSGDGATVTASPLGSADDAEGLGCEVHVTGVPIPDADDEDAASEQLVVRDGDLYVVHIAGVGGALAADAAQADADATAQTDATQATTAESTPGSSGSSESLNTVVDARLSITFPGAVVDAGGGTVKGTTVTWEDADLLYDGVSASGRAQAGAGVSAWDRYGTWIVAGVAVAGAVVGAAALWRLRSQRR